MIKNIFDITQFDFCDFGCSNGSSLQMGIDTLNGKKGFGIDIDPRKVQETRKKGYEAMEGNFCNLDLPDKCVNFTILSHVLEHLPTQNHAYKAIENAVRISKQFVFMLGPYFDADDYLKSLGLKFFWSDWSGHPLAFKTTDLIKILEDIKIQNYEIYGRKIVENSADSSIHPIKSPKNQHEWNQDTHLPKNFFEFSDELYREFMCIIWLSKDINPSNARKLKLKSLLHKKGNLFPL